MGFSLLGALERGRTVRIGKAGPAFLARLATRLFQNGSGAVLLARSRDEFKELESLARLFAPELSCDDADLSLPAWKRSVVSFPAGLGLRRDLALWPERLGALYALSTGPHVLVASFEAFMLRHVPRDFFSNLSMELCAGSELSQDDLLEQLVLWGYKRVGMVSRAGEVSRRGDLVDIFAAGYSRPARVAFFGDNVEEIRLFSQETQRSICQMQSLEVIPAVPCPPCASKAIGARVGELSSKGLVDAGVCVGLGQGEAPACFPSLFPGTAYADSSLLDEWIDPASPVLFQGTPKDAWSLFEGERDAFAKSVAEGVVWSEQSPGLCLCDEGELPWGGRACVSAEPPRIGTRKPEFSSAERPLSSFQELFTTPGAQDRPWAHVSAFLRSRVAEGHQVLLSFSSARTRARFLDMARQDGIVPRLRYGLDDRGVFALVSPFRHGADLEDERCVVLGENILVPKASRQRREPSRTFKEGESCETFSEGDLLVHRDYGIGRFLGVRRIDVSGVGGGNDFLELLYHGNDKLFVPVDKMGLVKRFKGDEDPALDRLGGTAWLIGKAKAKKAAEAIAADLVQMYAWRKVSRGFSYSPADELYREFESTFGYDETPGQAKAIEEVLSDMERPVPMDRLVCGDVGFGKTEVAMRAAFRAVLGGYQVALLCPTTVLAEQHYQTFSSRMEGFPVNVEVVSRIVSPERQRAVLASAAKGEVDVLIGTHRLLSSDVSLPKLGLLILDEEQRFGVRHKDRLKALRRNVDVLTLTATPIPRTLQLSLSGIRDLSVIETPPPERMPVETHVMERDEAALGKALRIELARKGQVFWVFNRVQGLAAEAAFVRRLAPDAKVATASGKMSADSLDDVMGSFWRGEIDVLVCTSIVESGLDFPNANTIIVDNAQNFGLGQLYQLRGRVGRSDRQAYAYFVVPDISHLPEISSKRLAVMEDLDYLGAGFQVAMEDLRLRGAGNIVGESQSGHIARVGIDLYLELLENAMEEIKGEAGASSAVETEISIGVPARIPETYIEDGHERLRCYRALTSARDGAERESIVFGLKDRFGTLPPELENFLSVLDFKQFLSSLDVMSADLTQRHLKLTWGERRSAVDPASIVALARRTSGSKLLPPATLVLPMPDPSSVLDSLSKLRVDLESIRQGAGVPPPASVRKKPEASLSPKPGNRKSRRR